MNIVLISPETPYNVGNIGRTCVLTNATLHLVKPFVISLDEKAVKRAGLDYWHLVKLKIWDSYDELIRENTEANFYYATTKTENYYSEMKYKEGDFIVFGPESKGISAEILDKNRKNSIKIPMIKMGRSLNLSNSVAIILYEALRQTGFKI